MQPQNSLRAQRRIAPNPHPAQGLVPLARRVIPRRAGPAVGQRQAGRLSALCCWLASAGAADQSIPPPHLPKPEALRPSGLAQRVSPPPVSPSVSPGIATALPPPTKSSDSSVLSALAPQSSSYGNRERQRLEQASQTPSPQESSHLQPVWSRGPQPSSVLLLQGKNSAFLPPALV